MWKILYEATHRRRDSGAWGNCSGVGFWTTRASDGQSPSPVFRRRRERRGEDVELGGASLRIAISSFPAPASARSEIGPFCFRVAGKLGAKFAGPLIIAGKCRPKQAKESNCPKTRNDHVRLSRLILSIRQKTSRRVSLRPLNWEFAGPLFLLMACGGVQIYVKTQISY
jgi:hypothetical protein